MAHKGHPTVVNMFASWCDQCERELPRLHDAAVALKGKIDFVFVNSNETGDWKSKASRHGLFDFEVSEGHRRQPAERAVPQPGR